MSGALLVTSLARRAREATRALEAKQLRNFASFGWSKFDAETMSAASPAVCTNLVGGDDDITDRLRAYRDAGVDTIRVGVDLNPRTLDDLAHLMDLVNAVNAESPAPST